MDGNIFFNEIAELSIWVNTIHDLKQYSGNESIMRLALAYSTSEVNKRSGYKGEKYDPKYRNNVIQGAIWKLERLGGEGLASYSDNGISASYKDVPEWLQGVVPGLGAV